ncbi:mycofactocin-coupled SDR family oxidoreductase [Mycobacterium sp. NBC_00419]|uniref:mycofactocin-coupled SDR family oxidoreductase n=1 Tax=Mycobacterium sp. NBC_00419 TaxID=2975989 RepID=UPI002E1CB008
MGALDGKVAVITGAARGQGRSHAVALAREGAAVIAIDICAQIPSVEYPMATPDDLAETVAQVHGVGGRIIAAQADVRDLDALRTVIADAESHLGSVDIVIANAGIAPVGLPGQDSVTQFNDVIDVNLRGVYNTVKATVGSLITKGSGSIVLVSSTQGLKGTGGHGAGGGLGYACAKHALVGMMRSLANWLGPQGIRVNSIHPTGVATPMIQNSVMEGFFAAADPSVFESTKNLLPVPWVQPEDISNAVLYLVCDTGRYVTGVALPVDAGFSAR